MQDCSHLRKTSLWCHDRLDWPVLGQKLKVSNSDQLFLCEWAIMVLETSTSSLSFRSSELSIATLDKTAYGSRPAFLKIANRGELAFPLSARCNRRGPKGGKT